MANMIKLRKITPKRMNKRGLQFRNAFFAVIVLGIVVTAVGILIGNWNAHYESGISYNLGQFNQGDSVSSTVEGYESTINPKTPDVGSDYQSNTLQSTYGIITNLISPFAIVFGQNGMLDAAAQIVGIPDYIIKPIVTMMILAIVFAVIAIVFRTFRTTT